MTYQNKHVPVPPKRRYIKNAMEMSKFLGKLSSNVSKERYSFKSLKISSSSKPNGRIQTRFNKYE